MSCCAHLCRVCNLRVACVAMPDAQMRYHMQRPRTDRPNSYRGLTRRTYGLLWAPVPCETRAVPQQVTVDTIVGGAFGATVHRPAGYVGETESGLGWACRCALLRGTSHLRLQLTQSCVVPWDVRMWGFPCRTPRGHVHWPLRRRLGPPVPCETRAGGWDRASSHSGLAARPLGMFGREAANSRPLGRYE